LKPLIVIFVVVPGGRPEIEKLWNPWALGTPLDEK
jgi:hypothetical protein